MSRDNEYRGQPVKMKGGFDCACQTLFRGKQPDGLYRESLLSMYNWAIEQAAIEADDRQGELNPDNNAGDFIRQLKEES